MAELYRRGNRPQKRQEDNNSYVANDGDVMMCNTNNNYTRPSYNTQQQQQPSNGMSSYGDEKKYASKKVMNKKFNGPGGLSLSSLSFMSLLCTIVLVSVSVLFYGGLKLRHNMLHKKYNVSIEHQKKLYQEQHTKRVEVSRERSDVRKLDHELNKAEKEYKELEQKLSNLKSNIVHYGKENDKVQDALSKASGMKVSVITGEKYSEDKMIKREDAWYHRIDLLHKRIQRESQRQLIEMFGTDQMRVELQLETKEVQGKVIIEMAPTNLMPHSVHLFLFQVLHKLWDGTSFAINAPHIMQAGAYSPEGKSVRQRFKDAGIETVAFQEYSSKFTHEKWHIGFAGRPGGPDIYINKMDNTLNHGPGGQAHHHLEEEADPAFAKVVGRKDVLQKMFDMPATGKNFLLKEYIIIKQARIIFPDQEPHAYDYKDYYDGFVEDDQYDLDEAYHEEYDEDDSSDDGEHHTQHLADRMRRAQMVESAKKSEQKKAEEHHEEMQREVTYRHSRETTHHLDEMM